MRVVTSTDWHGDWKTLGISRFSEIEAAVEQSVDWAIEKHANVYAFLGDLADPDSNTGEMFESIALAQRAAIRLRKAKISSIWLAGNHCVCSDGSKATSLTPLRSLGRYITVAERPMFLANEEFENFVFLCLPYTAPSNAYDPVEVTKKAMAEAGGRTVIILSHLSIPGITAGSETNDMPRGREVSFPLEEAKGAFCISGHYHKRQVFKAKNGLEIHVVGTLARLNFGEEDNEPGFMMFDL